MDGQKPDESQQGAPMQFVPGDTIRPQQQAAEMPAPPQAPEQAPEPPQPQQIPTPPAAVETPMPSAPPVTQNLAPFADESVYNTEQVTPQPSDANQSGGAVSWTASEFVTHHKTSGWYALLLFAAVAAAVFIWLLTKDMVSSVVVILAGAMLAAYANRKPRELSYQLDPFGLTIDQRHYDFNDFRSFSVVPEGAFSSIVFTPLKRFGTWTTIYYDPKDEDEIIDVISQRLPHEERKPDAIDSMMQRLRF